MTSASALGVPTIIDRCNLTVLLEPGQEDLAAFLAAHRVTVVASLPCYSTANVDGQRGQGVFERSIQVGGRRSSSWGSRAEYSRAERRQGRCTYHAEPCRVTHRLASAHTVRAHLMCSFGSVQHMQQQSCMWCVDCGVCC